MKQRDTSPQYNRADAISDLIAGLTVAVMLVPQSMAYALLAGLPAITGLYASFLPVIVYGLLGSSRILTLGPTAITSVMTLAIISSIEGATPADYVMLAGMLSLLLGGVYLLMGVLRLGFIVNLLSRPVLLGYVNAAALIILISQLQHLFGVDVGSSAQPGMVLWETITALPSANGVTCLISAVSVGVLLFFRHTLPRLLENVRWPETLRLAITRSGPLVLTLGMTFGIYVLQLDGRAGVETVGVVPAGLPSFTLPTAWDHWRALLPGATAIAFVGFMEGISTAKSLLSQRQQTLRPNRELIAMGAANIASTFTGGLPVTTSISRSAVNHAAGARSGFSSVVAGLALGGTLLFLAPAFVYLPRAVLASIIAVTVVNLFDVRALVDMWGYTRTETLVSLVTLGGVLVVGIETGILVGIGLMVALHLFRTTRLRVTELGRIDYTDRYDEIRHPDALAVPEVLIMRIDESLYFANAQSFDTTIRNALAERPKTRHLVLVFNPVNSLDATAVQLLRELVVESQELGVEIYIVGVKGRAFNRLRESHFLDLLGRAHLFDTTHAAVTATGRLIDEQLPI